MINFQMSGPASPLGSGARGFIEVPR